MNRVHQKISTQGVKSEEEFWTKEQHTNVDDVEEYRRRIVARQLIKLSRPYIKGRILDIGTGFGMLPDELRRQGFDCVGVDIAAPSLEIIKGSADDLPFPDNHFDTIFMNQVYVHLRPEVLSSAVNEIDRVLRQDGHFIITENCYDIANVHQTFCPKCGHSFNAYYAFRNVDLAAICNVFQEFQLVMTQEFPHLELSLDFIEKHFPWIRWEIPMLLTAYFLKPLIKIKIYLLC